MSINSDFVGIMDAWRTLVETLCDARRLHHQIPSNETFNLWKRMIRKVEHLENKISDLKLRKDGNKGPRNWREADDCNHSLLFFDPSMTQLLEEPSEKYLDEHVGRGIRTMGQVSATVGGATYRFSTVLLFDESTDASYKYHTLVTCAGEQVGEREHTDYEYAANYGEMLRDIICEEDDDSDDPSSELD